jgi:uncharacterized protein (DUF2235 family)
MMANIVICADGTWCKPEEDLQKDFPTNVLKVARAITPSIGDTKQHVFYDWGLGSYHNEISAGATGNGIHKNILDGYRYIVQNYNPGDKIFLFGFSRGAYTVRALSGLINNCGIVQRKHANLINEAWKIYKSPNKKNCPSGMAAKQFRLQNSHQSREINFVGVWDTVGALGIPFSLMGLLSHHDEFYDLKMGSNIKFARHALAIDEQRVDFEPTIWASNENVDLKQVWFAGVHTDVGGSYPPDNKTNTSIADIPLRWMLEEAQNVGLKLDDYLINSLSDSPLAVIHKSRTKIYRLRKSLLRPLQIKEKPTQIHISVKYRYENDSSYRPKQLEKLVESSGWGNIQICE